MKNMYFTLKDGSFTIECCEVNKNGNVIYIIVRDGRRLIHDAIITLDGQPLDDFGFSALE